MLSPVARPSLLLFIPLFQCARQQIHNYPHSRVQSMWNWDVGRTFPRPGAIDSSNKEAPTRMHLLARCRDRVFWQKLLGAAIEDLSSQNPERPPANPNPCPPSLPPVDTCSLWHLDWLPHRQRSRGPWLMCCMHCLAGCLWSRNGVENHRRFTVFKKLIVFIWRV